jgi:hypothetical protein
MGIFRHDLSQPERAPGAAVGDEPGADTILWVPCDRCQVAEAQVEVVTDAGSVFLCEHHHKDHHASIVAAGHLIRALPRY